MYLIPSSTRPEQLVRPETKTAVAIVGTVLIGTGSVYDLKYAESWQNYIQPRVPFVVDASDLPTGGTAHPDVRSPVEHIENIRSVLNPSVAELAVVFDVSRQAIYKWLSRDSNPEPDKFTRIIELSQIADAFHSARISRADALIKMKTFSGRSLMDLIKSGENSEEHVQALITEARAMENSYRQSGLVESKSKPTSDWQSNISIPGSSEHV